MTLQELIHSMYWRGLKNALSYDPAQFDEAQQLVRNSNFSVTLNYSDERVWPPNQFEWLIMVADTEFLLDAVKTLDEAKTLCEVMGWPIRNLEELAQQEVDAAYKMRG